MDPISAASSVLGLVLAIGALVKTCQKTARGIKGFINCSVFVEELSEDVRHFAIFLDWFQSILQDNRIARVISTEHTERVLAQAKKTVDKLDACLGRVINAEGTEIQVRRLKWLETERECRSLLAHLAKHREKLSDVMKLVNFDYTCRILGYCLRDPRIRELFAELEELQDQTLLVNLERSTVVNSVLIEPPPSTNASFLTDHHTEGGGQRSEMTPLIPIEQKTEHTIASGKVAHVSLRKKMRESHCHCECHGTNSRISDGLRKMLEKVFPSFLPIFGRSCSNFGCCARRKRPRHTFAISIRWLRNVVQVSMMSRQNGMKRSLRSPRQVPEGADSMRYAKSGNLEGLKRLIQDGFATPFDTAPDGWSLLHGAAYNGQYKVVKYLIDIGADVDVIERGTDYVRKPSDLARVRALIVDSSEVRREIANIFRDAEDFKHDSGLSPIHVALLGLYEHEDSLRPDLRSLLEFVQEADNAPAGTDWNQWKPERKFEDWKKSPLLREIIATYKATASTGGDACESRPKLIDQPDTKFGWTPFHWAVYTGRRAEMEVLIEFAADPFTITPKSRNALHLACESSNPEVLARVLDIPHYNGAWFNIDQPDQWEETPLHVAASRSAGCVKLLLENGAKKSSIQENGQVPLHYAYLADEESEKTRIVDLLTANGECYVNVQDEDNRTPIFTLLKTPQSIKILMSRAADASLLDYQQRSIFHYACVDDCAESLKILLRYCLPALTTQPDKESTVATHPDEEGDIVTQLDEESNIATQHDKESNLATHPDEEGDIATLPDEEGDITTALDKEGNITTQLDEESNIAIQPDKEGKTPISEAFYSGSARCAQLLIEANAIGDFNGKDGRYLVHYAARMGDVGVLRAVLLHPSYRRGQTTDEGNSAAYIAQKAGTWKPGFMELLLEYDSKGRVGRSLTVSQADAAEARQFYFATR